MGRGVARGTHWGKSAISMHGAWRRAYQRIKRCVLRNKAKVAWRLEKRGGAGTTDPAAGRGENYISPNRLFPERQSRKRSRGLAVSM